MIAGHHAPLRTTSGLRSRHGELSQVQRLLLGPFGSSGSFQCQRPAVFVWQRKRVRGRGSTVERHPSGWNFLLLFWWWRWLGLRPQGWFLSGYHVVWQWFLEAVRVLLPVFWNEGEKSRDGDEGRNGREGACFGTQCVCVCVRGSGRGPGVRGGRLVLLVWL